MEMKHLAIQVLRATAAPCLPFVAALSCVNAVAPAPSPLSLSVYIDGHEYFDNEPLYVVFQLTNNGSDTAWVMPFDPAEQSLQAVLVRSDGVVFRDWGIIADYITGPGWRGVPIAPQRSLYQIGTLQDRLGQYDSAFQNLYHSHHVPAGKYQLEAAFAWDPRHVHPPLRTSSSTIVVRSRTPAEDSTLAGINALVMMAWDTAKRATYLDSLVTFVELQAAADPADPYLPYLAVYKVITAAAVGYSPDSAMTDRLTAVLTKLALTDRDTPAGAEAVLGVSFYRPQLLPSLASQFGNSLAGNVARELAETAQASH